MKIIEVKLQRIEIVERVLAIEVDRKSAFEIADKLNRHFHDDETVYFKVTDDGERHDRNALSSIT